MTLLDFPLFAVGSIACWLSGTILRFAGRRYPLVGTASYVLMLAGTVSLMGFIAGYWHTIERPPLRTLGETRLWYAALIPVVGFLVEYRWKIGWLKYYCMFLAAFFLSINFFHPDMFDKTLMPALQSVWFVPHVVVYLVGYVLLAAASAAAWHNICFRNRSGSSGCLVSHYLVQLGFVLLTFGLVFGALWAKEAWGHYWTWDPKETWAFISWLTYLGYLHLSALKSSRTGLQWYIALSFVILLLSWFGVNYLPSAQNSVHSYQS